MMGKDFALIEKGTGKPLKLVRLSCIISIYGFIAETKILMVFENESNKDAEGELVFPLQENETVCGYSVDINGKLVEAVVVEKEKARYIIFNIYTFISIPK